MTIMSREVKKTEKSRVSHQEELEIKRKKYREWVEKNPYPMDHGTEMKECEGCYCQIFASNNYYSFCLGCIGCANLDCPWGCCDCYSDGSRGWKGSDGKIAKGSHRDKEKKLSFAQKQRLHWEQVIQNAWDMIEEIKDYEDTDDMLIAKKIEDVKRWSRQEKERIINDLTEEELKNLLKKFQKTKSKGNE